MTPPAMPPNISTDSDPPITTTPPISAGPAILRAISHAGRSAVVWAAIIIMSSIEQERGGEAAQQASERRTDCRTETPLSIINHLNADHSPE